jgi:hypothetical protein
MTNDGYEIGVVVTAMLSGKRIEATFHHDVEDAWLVIFSFLMKKASNLADQKN